MGRLTERLHATAILALLFLLGATRAHASPPGYFVDSTQANAERPIDRVEAEGDFTLSIHRRYEDPVGARLLAIAEATYPPRDSLVVIAIKRGFEVGSDSARTPLWWCDGLGVSRVPYAVTAGALEFYKNLTERFRHHNFWGAWDHNLFWTDFVYKATIAPRAEYYVEGQRFPEVFVVEMNL